MSCKLSMNNSVKLNSDQQQSFTKGSSVDSNVKLAGEEAKDRLYEPKHKKKLVRVLTVVAYVFFVSLAAIMLSLYYVFLWDANPKDTRSRHHQEVQFTSNMCTNGDKILVEVPYEPRAIPVIESVVPTTEPPPIDSDSDPEQNWSKFEANYTETREESSKEGPLMKKLMRSNLLD